MSNHCGSDSMTSTKPHEGYDKLDLVPLISRKKSLLSTKLASKSCADVKKRAGLEKEDIIPLASSPVCGADQPLAWKKSLELEVSPGFTSVESRGETAKHPQEVPCHQDLATPENGKCRCSCVDTNISLNKLTQIGGNADISRPEKVHFNLCTCDKKKVLSSIPEVKNDNSGDHELNLSRNGTEEFTLADIAAPKANSDDISYDNLDHVVLKERLRMLRERKLLGSAKHVAEGASVGTLVDFAHSCGGRIKEEIEEIPTSNEHPGTINDRMPVSCLPNSAVKIEVGISNELPRDELDHMLLQDRKKQRTLGGNLNQISPDNFDYSRKTEQPFFSYNPFGSGSTNPIKVRGKWKRKKTATNSVQTALQEDAPGLLQVLTEQGVSVDEIKLFGETESDDDLDETFTEHGFGELEEVMTKIFSKQRETYLKLASIRCTKGWKPSYCLACLFSLIEQSRYLEFRNWPVEWGWCRDLQSFLFVFKRHNRLVLERPEYGYATYFFELVDTMSTRWQVKRLLTAMKLTNFGRINLIEDKSLSVGDELSEGEAKVLMGFGWVPNTGLGTMLNYRDRVYHDRKNEKKTSEWRSKIGKLLADGYNSGTIVSDTLSAMDNIDCTGSDGPQIKVEL